MNLKSISNSRTASGNIYIERMSEPRLLDSSEGIYIGKSEVYKLPVFLDLNRLMNKNIAVLGMSGSGKSYFLKNFIIKSSLHRGSQVLVIDWNNEYSDVIKYLEGRVLTFGLNLKANLFELYDIKDPKGSRSVSDVISYFLDLNRDEKYAIYRKIIQISSRKGLRPANLSLLISELKRERDEISNVVADKLTQLKSNPMFADKNEFPVNEIIDGVVSIDFSPIRNDTQKIEISKSVIGLLVEIMHESGFAKPDKSEKIIIFDEAWRLIKNSEDIGLLFREGRKYGFCIAVATQLVEDINNEIISNSACVLLLRLQSENDYRLLVNSGIINDEQKNSIMKLPAGGCMLSIALREKNNLISKFFIENLDGIHIYDYKIRGGKMQNRISHKLMMESINGMNIGSEPKDAILNFLTENNNEVDDTRLIECMLRLGIDRPAIIAFLRALGLDDFAIVSAYEKAAHQGNVIN